MPSGRPVVLRAVLFCLALASAARGATITVPGDQPTIQAAIDVAVSGVDEIVLTAALYTGPGNRGVNFSGKNVTVRSASGDPALCVIDCQMLDRGFLFTMGETAQATLEGLTVRNGLNQAGTCCGGVGIQGASPTIIDCVFEDCAAENGAGDSYYGAIGVVGAADSPTISNCTFIGNSATYGAGMGNEGAAAVIGCTFQGNVASTGGGGLLNEGTGGVVTGCTFSANQSVFGGGIRNTGSMAIVNCVVVGNSATSSGGGIHNENAASTTIVNTVLTGNAAGEDGGGLDNFNSIVDVINCTIIGNLISGVPLSGGGGILIEGGGARVLTNCIVRGNVGPGTVEEQQILLVGGTLTPTYSNIEGLDLFANPGNIDANPMFVDANGADNVLGTADDDVRLDDFSPCIDAGDNAAVPAEGDPDPDGNPRFVDDAAVADTGAGTAPIVDIGAFERQDESVYTLIYVPDNVATIQAAIDLVANGGLVIVAPGTYVETIDFIGKAIAVWAPGGPGLTTIDGNGVGPVVTFASGEGPDAELDGFTITGGAVSAGAGVLVSGASPTIIDCVITLNVNDTSGGGMLVDAGSDPILFDVSFIDNTGFDGGGMSISADSSVTMTGGGFSGNHANGGGGVVTVGTATFTGTTFAGNTSNFDGAAINNFGVEVGGVGELDLVNCLLRDNVGSGSTGAAVTNLYGGTVTLTNCTFADNAGNTSGGLGSFNSATTAANCIFWANTPVQIAHAGSGATTVTYSDVQGGFAGTGNINADPLFTDEPSGDLRLEAFSPCIDAADNDAVPFDVTTDLDGNGRFVDDQDVADTGNPGGGPPEVVDMGVYERQIDSLNAVINVPGDQPTIQAGLDVARNGDEIVLASGTYTGAGNVAIDLNGKNVVIRSASGNPGLTIIDCEMQNRAFKFENGETSQAGLEGITIRNGLNQTGNCCGAVAISGANPTITNCVFENCEAQDTIESGLTFGGAIGILSSDAAPTIAGCTFINNDAQWGGAVYNFGAPSLSGCTFTNNNAEIGGGGFYSEFGAPTLTSCMFLGNGAQLGGGVHVEQGPATFTTCTFNSNNGAFGGGFYNLGTPALTGCTFITNTASSNGGGLMGDAGGSVILTGCTFSLNQAVFGGGVQGFGAFTVTDCTFAANTVSQNGGGMSLNQGSMTLSGCRFVANTAKFGGGLLNGFGGTATVTGCTFASNRSNLGGGMEISFGGTSALVNCVFDRNNGFWGGGGMRTYDSAPTLTNCSFYGNISPFGGGIAPVIDSDPTLTNCVLWANTAEEGDQIAHYASTATISFCDIQGSGGSGAGWDADLGTDGGGNLDADPRLGDVDGLDDIAGNLDDDLSLFITSPCIDHGDNAAPGLAGVTTDLGGDPRVINGTVDIGAYEFTPTQPGGAGPRLWNSLAGGSFGNGANWLPDLPGPDDEAVFEFLWTYLVSFGASESTGRLVVIDGQVTFDLNGHTYTLNEAAGEGGVIGPYSGTNARLTVTDGTLAGQTIRIGPGDAAMLLIDASGVVDAGAALRPDDGTLAGSGTVLGLLDNRGLVRPGNNPDAAFDFDALVVQDYAQTGGLEIEIGGTGPGASHDLLDVTNSATLGGALLADFVNGFVPVPGADTFTVVTAPAISGQFEVLYVTGLPEGQLMTIGYTAGADADAGSAAVTLVPIGFADQIGFSDPTTSSVDSGAAAVVLANLNGDSFPDMAVAVPDLDGIVVLLNDGSGTFTQQPLIPTGLGPVDLVAAALDNNASIDLAVVNGGDDTMTILINDGTGVFTASAPITVGEECGSIEPPLPSPCHVPVGVAAAQLVGDGALDLAVVGQFDGTVTIFENDGFGGFSLSSSEAIGVGGAPTDVAAGDFSGDGANDLIVTQGATGTVQVVLSGGGAAPAPGGFFMGNGFFIGGSPAIVCPEDIDNNKTGPGAVLDAVVVDASGAVSFLINTGTGLGPPTKIPVGESASSIGIVDMDGDLDLDIAVVVEDADLGSVVRILRNDLESGQLAFSLNENLAQGENPALVIAGDIDQDGEQDLVTINAPPPPPAEGAAVFGGSCPLGCIQSLLNAQACPGDTNGDNEVGIVDFLAVLGSWGPNPGSPADFDGDGEVGINDFLIVLGNWGPC